LIMSVADPARVAWGQEPDQRQERRISDEGMQTAPYFI
jgi:hypothetical protein